jgi:hypothetical protein
MIESHHRHDFQWCKCGQLAVDGGLSYVGLSGNALITGYWKPLFEPPDADDVPNPREISNRIQNSCEQEFPA